MLICVWRTASWARTLKRREARQQPLMGLWKMRRRAVLFFRQLLVGQALPSFLPLLLLRLLPRLLALPAILRSRLLLTFRRMVWQKRKAVAQWIPRGAVARGSKWQRIAR